MSADADDDEDGSFSQSRQSTPPHSLSKLDSELREIRQAGFAEWEERQKGKHYYEESFSSYSINSGNNAINADGYIPSVSGRSRQHDPQGVEMTPRLPLRGSARDPLEVPN